jgi:carboxyl-terminal processing protease
MLQKSVLGGILLFFSIFSFAQKKATPTILTSEEKADLLVKILQKKHCEPRKIDNLYSEQLYNSFLKNVDADKLIFTVQDEQQFIQSKSLLDDQIKSKNLIFLKKVGQVYRKRLQKLDSLIKQFTLQPIDLYSKSNYLESYQTFSKDEKEWNERWQNQLKYEILRNIFNSMTLGKTPAFKPNYNDKNLLTQKEANARKRVRESNLRDIKEALGDTPEVFEKDLATDFLQAMAQLYDVHTEYYGINDVEDFIKSGSTRREIFGFRLDENKDGEVELATLSPGSPAWKSGQLNKGDVIVALQWENEEQIDVVGADISEVNEILSGHEDKILHLTVRKASQQNVVVSLKRAIVEQDEQGVRGFILNAKDKKFGYIDLPAFYSDFEDENGSGCANDVAKELVKFNQEGIKGLILDLRFNGGGSLREALDLAGIFIDQGVFGAYKSNSPKSMIAKDPNRGSIYDGPMIVLTNQASASASEILAGILQDYNRAVIVGAKTFGKGVAQTVAPIDTLTYLPKDFAKMTVFRIFRPSGRALQTRGVVPDVVLPSMFDNLEIGERFEDFPLSADTLTRTLLVTPLPNLPIQKLAQKSAERIKNQAAFASIKQVAMALEKAEKNKNQAISLDWNVFQQQFSQERNETDRLMKAIDLTKTNFTASPTQLEKQRESVDTYRKELNEQLFETLKKDAYIDEALNILLDWL